MTPADKAQCLKYTRHMNFNVGTAFWYLWTVRNQYSPKQALMLALSFVEDELKHYSAHRRGVPSAIEKMPLLPDVNDGAAPEELALKCLQDYALDGQKFDLKAARSLIARLLKQQSESSE